MFKILLSQIRKLRLLTTMFVLTILVTWILNIISPLLSGMYIDYLVGSSWSCYSILLFIIIAVVNLLQVFIRYIMALVSSHINQEMIHYLNNDILQVMFASVFEKYGNIDSAYYVDQINKDSTTIVHFFTSNLVNFFLNIATFIICSGLLFYVDKVLFLIIGLLIPIYIFTFKINKEKLYMAYKDSKEKNNEYFSKCSEQINKLEFIKKNAINSEMKDRLDDIYGKKKKTTIKSVKVEYLFTNLSQIIILIAYLCVIGMGGYKVNKGSLSIGYFTIINTYFTMLIKSVTYFLGVAGTYQKAKVSYERINDILSSKMEKIGKIEPAQITHVAVNNLTVAYGDIFILNKYNYDFELGKIYGLQGCNGGGKTTLLNALMGIFAGEHTGTIIYNNQDIELLNMKLLRYEKISFLDQNPIMFNMDVKEYLKLGVKQTQDTATILNELINMFKIEYLLDKTINENGSNFSGGEKQKLALSRVLSKESCLLLLDEPTSALDIESTQKLMDYLCHYKRDKVTIIVTHDPLVLQKCDEIVLISGEGE